MKKKTRRPFLWDATMRKLADELLPEIIALKDTFVYTNDLDSNSEYIKIGQKDQKVHKTLHVRKGLDIDMNKQGEVVGVEIIR